MSSYAENEQDAREYAELQRQFAEEKLEEQRERAKEKPVVTMDEIMDHRFQQRNLENAERHMTAQNDWSAFLKSTNNGEDYERSDEQLNLLREIDQIVGNNILYGTPPYSLESAEDILLDILNDLTSMKERLGLAEGI
jgi:alkanesulfonate monooxygenase SsuD/methylene tetrahydromethanopterin reductase-like flavin-dependent oxidoreductase (luciferase family)